MVYAYLKYRIYELRTECCLSQRPAGARLSTGIKLLQPPVLLCKRAEKWEERRAAATDNFMVDRWRQ